MRHEDGLDYLIGVARC